MDNDGVPIADEILAYNDDGGNGSNFSISCYVEAYTDYYLWIRSYDGSRLGKFEYTIVPPSSSDGDYFEWSSDVHQGGAVKNVNHTEWNNFIDKIKEVLTDKGRINQPITESKYGYSEGTTYNTMLNDCYLKQYDSDLQGYPLTAQKFNVARFIIGSHVSTGISDKVSNSSKVLASDFIKLADCLRTWQG